MTDADLLPCPFCGSSAEIVNGAYATWVACTKCQCTGEEGDVEEAITAWNRRSQPDAPIHIDIDRMQKSLSSGIIKAPTGMSLKEKIEFMRQCAESISEEMAQATPAPQDQTPPQRNAEEIYKLATNYATAVMESGYIGFPRSKFIAFVEEVLSRGD